MTLRPLRTFALSILLFPGASAAVPSGAGSARSGSSLAALEAENAALRAEVEALRQAVAALRTELTQLRAAADEEKSRAERVAAAEQRLAAVEAALAGIGGKLDALGEAGAATADAVDSLEKADTQSAHLAVYGNFATEDRSTARSTFDAESFELVLSGRPHPRLGYFAEVEFERAAAVGGERGGEVLLEQAWVSYAFAPSFNLRAGALLVPFGNVNVDHYAPNRDVVSKPLTAVVVAPSDWTDNGLMLYGRATLPHSLIFNYETAVVAGLGSELSGLGTRAARQPFGRDNNQNKAFVGRFSLRRGAVAELGLSAYRGRYDDAGRRTLDGWALDGQAALGPLHFTGEVNRLRAERGALPGDRYEGWYGRATYDFVPPFLRRGWHGSSFPEARFSLVSQLDEVRVRGPLDGAVADNRERRWTWGFNYRPTHEWVLKVNYERTRAPGLALVNGEGTAWLTAIGFVF